MHASNKMVTKIAFDNLLPSQKKSAFPLQGQQNKIRARKTDVSIRVYSSGLTGQQHIGSKVKFIK